MLETEEVAHIILLSTMNLSAMVANIFYMFIVKLKTPTSLSSYAQILFSIACVDFCAAFCSFMTITRLRSVGTRMIMVYLGPCTAISAQWCHSLFSGHANFVVQSVLLLLTSFSYRLWVLKLDSVHQQRHGKWWTALRVALLALAVPNTIMLSVIGKYEAPCFPKNQIFSVFDLSGGLAENTLSRLVVSSNQTMYFIGFVTIFKLRRNLFSAISALSSSDRYNHQLIYRSLTAQMMLPLTYVFGTSLWLLDVVGIINSPTLQRSILLLSSLFALASPLINLYYIPPYRKYLNSLLSTRKQVVVQNLAQFNIQRSPTSQDSRL